MVCHSNGANRAEGKVQGCVALEKGSVDVESQDEGTKTARESLNPTVPSSNQDKVVEIVTNASTSLSESTPSGNVQGAQATASDTFKSAAAPAANRTRKKSRKGRKPSKNIYREIGIQAPTSSSIAPVSPNVSSSKEALSGSSSTKSKPTSAAPTALENAGAKAPSKPHGRVEKSKVKTFLAAAKQMKALSTDMTRVGRPSHSVVSVPATSIDYEEVEAEYVVKTVTEGGAIRPPRRPKPPPRSKKEWRKKRVVKGGLDELLDAYEIETKDPRLALPSNSLTPSFTSSTSVDPINHNPSSISTTPQPAGSLSKSTQPHLLQTDSSQDNMPASARGTMTTSKLCTLGECWLTLRHS